VKTQITGAAGVLGAFFAGSFIVEGFRNLVRGAAELSDAQADVQRTTGLTRAEVNSLTKDLSQLNTRTARSELLALAADAGKLGITGRDNLMQFVRAGDQIRVALGEDLGEDAIKNIGKLNQTFDVGKATGKGLEEQMLATGSAINALGQSSTAQESYLVDFTTRMAGVNKQAGINIQNTLGYAAALDQLGQRSETSSTALAQFTLKAFSDTAEYAKIAGMGLEEFTALLNSDTNEALLRVLEGLQGNNEGLTRMTALFGDLGQEGARAVGVLSSLASNTKLVREQQAIANKEFAAGTSITNEFNTKNATLGANLEIIGKKIAGAFVNSAVVAGINKMAAGLREMVSPSIADGIEKERQELFKLHSQILTTNEGSTARIKLVNELQQKYPQILGNLNAETASNAEVAKAVKAVNEQLINRIIIAKQQERIDAEIAEIAERREARLEAEDVVLKKLEAAARKYGVELQAGATVLEQSQRTYVLIKAAQDQLLQGRSAGGVLVNDVARLGVAIRNLEVAQGLENGRTEMGNRLMEERLELMRRLGMTDEADTTATDNPGPAETGAFPETTPGAPDKAALDEANRQLEQWRVDLLDLREGIYQDGLSADEREIRQLDVQHARELAKLRANALATAEDIKALESQQARERADLIAGQGDERAGKYSEAAAKVRRAMLSAQETELEDELKKWDELIALGEKYELDVSGLVEKREAALAAIRKKWKDKELSDEEKKNADALAAFKKSMQQRVELLNGFAQLAGSVTNLIDAVKAAEEQRADADGVRTAEEIQRIQQLENRRKAAALVQIALSSATGVAQAIQAGAGVPWPGNLVAIAAGITAVLSGIAQAYAVLNTATSSASANTAQGTAGSNLQNVPLGEKGGVFEGPSHAEGGLKVYDPRSQRVVAEVEGGEPWMVLSKAFRRANPGALAKLMAASATGSKLHIAEHGGIFGTVPTFNFRGAHEAIRLASGGVVGAAPMAKARPGQADAASQATVRLEQLLEALLAEQRVATKAALQYPTQLRAVVSTRDLNRKQIEDDRYRSKAVVKRR
jgi:TP901 family phage tail tape measure protein